MVTRRGGVNMKILLAYYDQNPIVDAFQLGVLRQAEFNPYPLKQETGQGRWVHGIQCPVKSGGLD